ncbi:hypothetical protein LY78DRAFT_675635 [Colletotrichum sublineola]|nr:hypothetical protein LY78DRAFT_675635 [Colletotrichum sublineola]
MSWLKADSVIFEQENIIDAITEEPRKYHNGSSWILKSSPLLNWLQDRPERPIIWLQGKAGSEKSVIVTQVTNFLSNGQDRIVVRHFCSYAHQESLQYERVLTSFISQLLRHNDLDSDLIGFVYHDCVIGKKVATSKTLEALLITLLQAITPKVGSPFTVRIFLDGLDECDQARQGKFLSLIKQIVSIQPKGRRTDRLPYRSHQGFRFLLRLRISHIVAQEVSNIVTSTGMFLWARLVLDYLDSEMYYDKDEIFGAIEGIPSQLSDLYKRILHKITHDLQPQSIRRIATSLAWIAFSYRPLRLCELQSALASSSGKQEVSGVPPKRVIEPLKLLVEEKPDSTLTFIHFSVAE